MQSEKVRARRGAGNEPKRRAANKVVAIHPSRQPGTLKAIGGSMSDDWNNRLVNDVLSNVWLFEDDKDRDRKRNAAVAALVGMQPTSELEGMLAAQLLASHYAAMECYRRAMIGEQTFEGRHENLNQANKLSRTHAALLEALDHHRGKGQQKVTVEHVHVHAGGQAIVGAVNAPGGGGTGKNEEQPYAKQIGHAPEPPLRSPNAQREPLPVASDGERPMPDARRTIDGSAKG
jgi:hypothetical protein